MLAAPASAQHAHARARAALAMGAAGSAEGRLWVTGLDDRGRLFVRSTADLGRRWSPDVLPDIGADLVAADGESRPKLAVGPEGRLALAYNRPLARPYTGEVRLIESTDGGRSWSPPITVHQDRQPIAHRFESIAFDPQGNLHVWWIDKRDQVAAGQPGASVYRAVRQRGADRFGPDQRVASDSCECCRIALLPEGENGMAALWRHVFPGSERDHAFLRTRADGEDALPATPVRASQDRWQLQACPHHGPGLAPARGGGYHAVWFGERDGLQSAWLGRLDARGAPVGMPVALPDPAAEHADVAAIGERVAVVWRSFDGRRTHLRAWISTDDGQGFTLREIADTPLPNDHPRLARLGERWVVVWRTAREIRIETLLQP
ncbi:MAG: glycoside hydrolase [Betaproteobacteria bacterium]|nr:glycoside hydrolase [Betaproteobacteria bacterium]